MSIIIETNLLQDEYSYYSYSYSPEDENVKEKPRAASTPPPEIHAKTAVQPQISVSLPALIPQKKWAARPVKEEPFAASSSSSNLPARVPTAVAVKPQHSEPPPVFEYNDRDDVGTIAIANYSEIQDCSTYELFNDLRCGPAFVIVLQDVSNEIWRRFSAFNEDDAHFHQQWVGNVAVLAKKDRVRNLAFIVAHNIEVNDKIVLTILVVGVRLIVPFCNSSSITVASLYVTQHMQQEDLEFACDKLKSVILDHDIRIIGGIFGEDVLSIITGLRGCGVLVNLAAWLPFTSEDGENLFTHQSHVLITGSIEDKANNK